MNKLLAALLATVVMAPAFATVSGDNSCQGNCSGTPGTVNNNSSANGGNSTSSVGNVSSNSTSNGGNATANGGNASIAPGAVKNDNTNSNTNVNLAQGGKGGQGGQGGQGGSASALGVGIGLGGKGGNANSNQRQSQDQAQNQSQANIQGQAIRNSGNSANNNASAANVNVAAQERNPVNTAYAPSIHPTAVCMGSTTAGGQSVAVGLSFGTSWTDQNCMLLEQVRTTVTVLGDRETASEMMCSIDSYREARIRLGRPCKNAPQTTGTQTALSTQAEIKDPYVRIRMGLPPLPEQK